MSNPSKPLKLSEKLVFLEKLINENGLALREFKIERKEHEDESETRIWLSIGFDGVFPKESQ